MEDKPTNFYEFLTTYGNKKEPEKRLIKPIYKLLAWIVILIVNTLVLQFCWNYGIKQLCDVQAITFIQSILVYTFVKILTRGLFTVQ